MGGNCKGDVTHTNTRKKKKLNKNQNNKEKRIDRQANIMAVRHRTKERKKQKFGSRVL